MEWNIKLRMSHNQSNFPYCMQVYKQKCLQYSFKVQIKEYCTLMLARRTFLTDGRNVRGRASLMINITRNG